MMNEKRWEDMTDEEREQRRIEKAEKIPFSQYDGEPFYCERYTSGDDSEYYFNDLETLAECINEHYWGAGVLHVPSFEDVPTHLWLCDRVPFKLTAENIIENELEHQEFFEDAIDHIKDGKMAELQTLLDKWCTEVNLGMYIESTKKVYVLTDEDRQKFYEEYLKEE